MKTATLLLGVSGLASAKSGDNCASTCREYSRHLLSDSRSTVKFLPDPAPESSGYSHIQQLSTGCTLGCLQETKKACDDFSKGYVQSFKGYPILVNAYAFACNRWENEGKGEGAPVTDYTHAYHKLKEKVGIPDEAIDQKNKVDSCGDVAQDHVACLDSADALNRKCEVKDDVCVAEVLTDEKWEGEQPCYPLKSCETWSCRHWCRCFEKFPTIEAELQAADLCQISDHEVCDCSDL
jgi:hypothetical protein